MEFKRMMKHKKARNPGIIFEILSKNVSLCIADRDVEKGRKLYSLINKYFLGDTYLKEVFERIYSTALYGDMNNYFYASKYLKYILEEYRAIDQSRLDAEVDQLLREVDSVVKDRKQLFKSKVENYRLHASLKVLCDAFIGKFKLSAKEKMLCEKNVLEHLVNNSELKRMHESHAFLNVKRDDDVLNDQISVVIALKKFKEKYHGVLTNEQNQCLIHYLTSPSEKLFNRWAEKKLKSVLGEIASKKTKVQSEETLKKLNIVEQKFSKLVSQPERLSKDLVNVLLSFELKNILGMF